MSAGNRGFLGFSSDESGNNVSSMSFSFPGTLLVQAGSYRIYNETNRNFSLQKVCISVNTVSSSGNVVGDVYLNGVSIFKNTANRPTALQGNNRGQTDILDQRDWKVGDYLQAGLVSIGTNALDCVIQVVFQ